MHTVIETASFLRAANAAGMNEAERRKIVDLVADQPDTGVVLRETGGCRKFRVAREGGGKSGGYRVVSFYSGTDIPAFLITVFGKGEKDNLSKAERLALKKLADTLVETYTRKALRRTR